MKQRENLRAYLPLSDIYLSQFQYNSIQIDTDMNASFRRTALKSTESVGRTWTNRNVPIRHSRQRFESLSSIPSVQLCRSIQTSTKLWASQSEKNADNLLTRESLNPSRSEGTQSGTDDEVASHDASFDPHITAPEADVEATERESVQRHKSNNPLDVSAGNREVNKTRDPSKDPPEGGVDKPHSARGWTRKNKAVNQEK